MPRWTKEQLDEYERKRSSSKAGSARQNSVMECPAGHEPLAKDQGQEAATGRLHIRFVSVRKRLMDPDNLCEKFLLDCLRYVGAISGDEPEKISIETTQRKAAKGEAEHTVIEISQPMQDTEQGYHGQKAQGAI